MNYLGEFGKSFVLHQEDLYKYGRYLFHLLMKKINLTWSLSNPFRFSIPQFLSLVINNLNRKFNYLALCDFPRLIPEIQSERMDLLSFGFLVPLEIRFEVFVLDPPTKFYQ